MGDNRENPAVILFSALAAFAIGGFLLAVDIGMNGRKAQGIDYGFNFRGAESAVTAGSGGPEKGKKSVKSKTGYFASGYSGQAAEAAPRISGRLEQTRRQAAWEADDEEDDSYSRKPAGRYSSNSERMSESGFRSWADMDGGESASSAGNFSSRFYGGAASGAYGKSARKWNETALPARRGSSPSGDGSGGQADGGGRASASQMYASARDMETRSAASTSGRPSVSDSASPGGSDGKLQEGGGMSGMPGQHPGGSLGGALESLKTGSQSSYGSNMSGGAKSVESKAAASGGGAPPAVPPPQKASTGGGGGAPGGDVGADGKTGGKTKEKEDKKAEAGDDDDSYAVGGFGNRQTRPDFLQSVVIEKWSSAYTKYVTKEETSGVPDEKMLKTGYLASVPDKFSDDKKNLKDNKVSADKRKSGPDPKNWKSLSGKRKLELKKEIHIYLAKVENKYGQMIYIDRTSCSQAMGFCKEHGVTESYLAMTTAQGAKVVVGFRYVDDKWRLFVIDFKPPKVPLP